MSVSQQAKAEVRQAKDSFTNLSIDDQLALLWFVYKEMGASVTPAAPNAASPKIAMGLFEQVQEKSHQEQLEIMRDIARRADTQISREYGALSANTKLAFWYFLAKGMDQEIIIPMPTDYQFSDQGQTLLKEICDLDFEQQITFLRDIAMEMGAEPATLGKV